MQQAALVTKTKKGNCIQVDSDFIFTTISVNFDVNYRQFKYFFCLSRKNARCALATQNKKKVYNDRCQQVYNPFIKQKYARAELQKYKKITKIICCLCLLTQASLIKA